ncbi:hypothetical protein [Nonomuraea angiospora]|uniref:hypothetical protein n=1 Tax=Nonomuraea angiospora TaxID=46172 RepID=UPI0029B4B2C5|nr:hypothetical protein [Nonomuraea angiospora]MDX3109570.1 hypothetical protein [Nonomuraea angiospora]
MTINTTLLLGTLQHIDIHRDDWTQGCWRTCFAGHAVILAGGKWAVDDPDHPLHYVLVPEDDDLAKDVGTYTAADGWDGEPLQAVTAQARAKRVLGLDDDQAFRLFDSRNDLPRLYTIVSQLCEEAGA